jgi:hypothetical protein
MLQFFFNLEMPLNVIYITKLTHFGVVISAVKVTQPFTDLIGTRSTPILILAIGMYLAAT